MFVVWALVGVVVGGALTGLLAWCRCRAAAGKGLRANLAAQERLTELSQLAGGLAHEIKNPLSTINVNLRLLAEDIQRHEDDEHRRWLRRLVGVQTEADRLKATLDDFQRLAGKVELSCQRADLRTVVDEVVAFFAPQAEADHVILRSRLPDDPVICNIDVNLIKQALLNLLLNAVQAITDGGELIVHVTCRDGLANLEVIDTGPGLSPDDVEKIFHVYYSTKKGGTGLGLPATRRIVREHGGTMRVDSELGQGTRFTICLPCRPA